MKKSLVLGLFGLCCSAAIGQQNSSPINLKLADSIANYYTNNAPDRIDIQTDKIIYQPNDLIWFKAFLVNQFTMQMDRNSPILFADLVDSGDVVLTKAAIRYRTFQTEGYLQIPGGIPGGHYWLRIYKAQTDTHRAPELGLVHLFILDRRQLEGRQTAQMDQLLKLKGTSSRYIHFSPEGGHFTNGFDQHLDFGISHPLGLFENYKGYIVNDEDADTLKFRTIGGGYAHAVLPLKKDLSYNVVIDSPRMEHNSFEIPAGKDNTAFVSIATKTDSTITVQVNLGNVLFAQDLKTVLLGCSHGQVFYASGGTGIYEKTIRKKDIPGGEATFLLLNLNSDLLSARRFANTEEAKVKITLNKDDFAIRQHVNADIDISGKDNQPVVAYLTVSVTSDRSTSQKYPSESSMGSRVQPAQDVQLDKLESYRPGILMYGPTSNYKLTGKVANAKNGGYLARHVLTLYAKLDSLRYLTATDTTDDKGKFNLLLPEESESTEFKWQVKTIKGSDVDATISLDSLTYPTAATPLSTKTGLDSATSAFLSSPAVRNVDTTSPQLYNSKILALVTITGKKKKILNYDETKRLSPFSNIISWDQIPPGYQGVGNAILQLPGFHMANGYLILHGFSGFSVGPGMEPLLVIDGIAQPQSTDSTAPGQPSPLLATLAQYSADDIDFVEVMRGPEAAYWGIRGGNGVIVINTRQRPRPGITERTVADLPKFRLNGIQQPKAFVAPDYEANNQIEAGKDHRPTIYWNPSVTTDNNGKASISFFTSDDANNFTLTVTGYASTGEKLFATKKIVHSDK